MEWVIGIGVVVLVVALATAGLFRFVFDFHRMDTEWNEGIRIDDPHTLKFPVDNGQDPIAVAYALTDAGFKHTYHLEHGIQCILITTHDGSSREREHIRSVIFNAPTLEGAEWHPTDVVFGDEKVTPGQVHDWPEKDDEAS